MDKHRTPLAPYSPVYPPASTHITSDSGEQASSALSTNTSSCRKKQQKRGPLSLSDQAPRCHDNQEEINLDAREGPGRLEACDAVAMGTGDACAPCRTELVVFLGSQAGATGRMVIVERFTHPLPTHHQHALLLLQKKSTFCDLSIYLLLLLPHSNGFWALVLVCIWKSLIIAQ